MVNSARLTRGTMPWPTTIDIGPKDTSQQQAQAPSPPSPRPRPPALQETAQLVKFRREPSAVAVCLEILLAETCRDVRCCPFVLTLTRVILTGGGIANVGGSTEYRMGGRENVPG